MNGRNRSIASISLERRVAFFLPSLSGGGAEKIMLNIAKGFLERRVPIDLVLSQRSGQYIKHVPSAMRVIDLASSRPICAVPGLVRYLRAQRPRVLFSTLTNANVAALAACKLSNTRVSCVVRETSALTEELRNSTRFNRFVLPTLIRSLYSLADAVVAPSNGAADELSSAVGLQRKSIRVIYNPVVSASMLSQAGETPDHPWLIENRIPVILGIGRLSRQKDFITLIQAFSQVRRRFNSRLVILGEGELRPDLERVAFNEGVQEDVSLPGFVLNPYPYLKNAKVFVLSSRWEGLPNALIEALACGTPVIATNCPHGPAEILSNGRFGQLVSVGNVSALAQAIQNVLGGAYEADDHSAHILKFDAKTNIDEYLKLLNKNFR